MRLLDSIASESTQMNCCPHIKFTWPLDSIPIMKTLHTVERVNLLCNQQSLLITRKRRRLYAQSVGVPTQSEM